jgi:hypothetical protein
VCFSVIAAALLPGISRKQGFLLAGNNGDDLNRSLLKCARKCPRKGVIKCVVGVSEVGAETIQAAAQENLLLLGRGNIVATDPHGGATSRSASQDSRRRWRG